MRLEQVEKPLARFVPTDEQHVRRPVLPARDGHGVRDARNIDPVRDDLVVAREVAVDEVARRRRHRDPAVQPLGVPAHHPAPELVRRREARVGMEGRDVHALRLAQDDERQERHERLVEVEQVEPLALEHVVDLRQVPRRERERPDGRIARDRDADAEPDDVALGRALRAVARGQDADVVAALAEPLVEELDVLGDAAARGVDVRADEADLHDAPGGS